MLLTAIRSYCITLDASVVYCLGRLSIFPDEFRWFFFCYISLAQINSEFEHRTIENDLCETMNVGPYCKSPFHFLSLHQSIVFAKRFFFLSFLLFHTLSSGSYLILFGLMLASSFFSFCSALVSVIVLLRILLEFDN